MSGNSEKTQADSKYEEFLQHIDDWIKSRNITTKVISKEKLGEVEEIIEGGLSGGNYLEKSFKLCAYLDYLQCELNRERAILDWCDDSVLYIVSPKTGDYGDQFKPGKEKFNCAVRDNPLASNIYKLRNNVRARVTLLDGRIPHIKKMSDIFYEMGRK